MLDEALNCEDKDDKADNNKLRKHTHYLVSLVHYLH